MLITVYYCRKEGIRTLDTVTRILPFQGSLFNHSSTFLCKESGANLLTFSHKTNRFLSVLIYFFFYRINLVSIRLHAA